MLKIAKNKEDQEWGLRFSKMSGSFGESNKNLSQQAVH